MCIRCSGFICMSYAVARLRPDVYSTLNLETFAMLIGCTNFLLFYLRISGSACALLLGYDGLLGNHGGCHICVYAYSFMSAVVCWFSRDQLNINIWSISDASFVNSYCIVTSLLVCNCLLNSLSLCPPITFLVHQKIKLMCICPRSCLVSIAILHLICIWHLVLFFN